MSQEDDLMKELRASLRMKRDERAAEKNPKTSGQKTRSQTPRRGRPATNAPPQPDEEFSLIERQVERLRERLLDLSKRNRLLNFKHPERSRKQARVVDELPAILFERLLSDRSFRFKAVDEHPDPTTGVRIPVADAARQQGLNPNFDLGAHPGTQVPEQHADNFIQLLHYPTEMARRLEGMRQEHLTSLQELGVPSLHAVFGFLEWYEKPDSPEPLLSPLVLVPLEIERMRESGLYQYRVSCTAEEPEPNRTLSFRLKQDLGLLLPDFDDLVVSRDLDAYFSAVETAVKTMPRWRLRRFVTICAVSFARQVMYEDLAPERWASVGGRGEAPLVRRLLAGGDTTTLGKVTRAAAQPLLITDADSTQVAAIQDALAGRSMVVKGPPGTGKSQTITNLIAAALAANKRVLFVAEKMAALDVVKKRLDDAGLANFCLALHSTKAKKREVLEALEASRQEHQRTDLGSSAAEPNVKERAQVVGELEDYLHAMASELGSLGGGAKEIVWREQLVRTELGAVAPGLLRLVIPGVLKMSTQHLQESARRLGELETANGAVGGSLDSSPWSFVTNWDPLQHSGDAVAHAVERWVVAIRALTAPLVELGWPADELRPDELEDLGAKLADLTHAEASAPAGLVGLLLEHDIAVAALELAADLEARSQLARRLDGVCAVDKALPHRTRFLELVGVLRDAHLLTDGMIYSEISSVLQQRRAAADALKLAADSLQALARRFEVPGNWDKAAQRSVLLCGKFALDAGELVIKDRVPGCLENEVLPLLEERARSARALGASRSEIEQRLRGWDAVGAEELRRHATALDSTSFVGRLFGSNPSEAAVHRVEQWADAVIDLAAPFVGLEWPTDSLRLDELEALGAQLSDLPQADAALVALLLDHDLALSAVGLANDLEARRVLASRIDSVCPVDTALPHRSQLVQLISSLRDAQLPSDGVTYAGLPDRLHRRRTDLQTLTVAAGDLQTVGLQLDLAGASDKRTQRTLLLCGKLAVEAGSTTLKDRVIGCLDDDVTAFLDERAQSARSLNESRAELDQELSGWAALGAKELRRHATVLRSTGFFGRVFGSTYKISVGAYLSLSTGRPATREVMAARLQKAAEQLEAEEKWLADPRLGNVCGRAYRGLSTDFDALTRVAAWGAQVRRALPGADTISRWARDLLFAQDTALLAPLIEFYARVGGPLLKELDQANHELTTSLASSRAAIERIDAALGRLAGLGIDGRTLVTDLAQVSETLEAVAAHDAKLEASPLRSRLGSYWLGPATNIVTLRAAVSASMSLQESAFPPFVETWLVSPEFARRVTQAISLGRGILAGVDRERLARDEARGLGIAVAEVFPPGVTVEKLKWRLKAALKAYKEASRAFRSLSTGGVESGEVMARTFQKAAMQLEAEKAWLADPRLGEVCGRAYRGLSTDFEGLSRVAAWGASVRSVFSGSETIARWARTLLFSTEADSLAPLIEFYKRAGSSLLEHLDGIDTGLTEDVRITTATVERIGHALSGVANLGLDGRTAVANLTQVAAVLETVATLDAKLDVNPARRRLGSYWLGAVTDFIALRAAVSASTTIREIAFPSYVASWLVTAEFANRVAHAIGLGRGILAAVHRERLARDDARASGVGIAELLAPGVTIQRLTSRLQAALTAGTETLAKHVRYVVAREACRTDEAAWAFYGAVEEAGGPWTGLAQVFEWCALRTLCAELMKRHPKIAKDLWSGSRLTQLGQQVRAYEQVSMQHRRARLVGDLASTEIPEGRRSAAARDRTDLALLVHEIGKQKRNVPIRVLMSRAKDAILALTPCLMMSPLSIAQFLEDPELQFDLLIVDEASQLRPEESIGALLRARQVVVVGDEQQLPPTSFFKRSEDEEADEEDDEEVDAESLLDLAMHAFGEPKVLRWHYRSRHESLIGFSNAQFYRGELVVAPSPRSPGPGVGVSVETVRGLYKESRNDPEANRVVELVFDLMKKYPKRSIGVVGINQQQSELIRERIDERVREDAIRYIESWRGTLEPFFVKNLENVQGDERDIIVISMTYGPDETGRVYQRFGPIIGAHGHRRLNVLFSRAKHQLVLVTSLRPEDVHVEVGSSRGVQIFRAYLEYAANHSIVSRKPGRESKFTRVVREIRDLGFDVVQGVGAQSLEIDLGVRHPDDPSSFIAGVEVDAGESASLLRSSDRELTRPLVLGQLGWSIVQTWTSDWLRDPATARGRLREGLVAACRSANKSMPPPRAVVVSKPLDEASALPSSALVTTAPSLAVEVRVGDTVIGLLDVHGARIRVGRGQQCEVRIPDQYEEVAAQHLELRWERGSFSVASVDARAGIYVNGVRIAEGSLNKEQTYTIRLGLGAVVLRLAYGGPLAPYAATAARTAKAGRELSSLLGQVVSQLGPDERQFMTAITENGQIRTSELVALLGKSPVRVNGMVRQVRRRLHEAGVPAFFDESRMPDGEVVYQRSDGRTG